MKGALREAHPIRALPGFAPWDGSLCSSERYGLVPALLLVCTAATGLMDAASVLGLGRVLVTNTRGNVVFRLVCQVCSCSSGDSQPRRAWSGVSDLGSAARSNPLRVAGFVVLSGGQGRGASQ